MAHDLDVDTFDHPGVRNLVDSLLTPRALTVTVKGKVRKVNLARRADKFLVAVQTSVMRCWWFIDHSEQNECTPDPPIVALPPPVQPPS